MNFIYRLQVLLMMRLMPVHLFARLNQLDWYQNTLRQWLDQQNFTAGSNLLEVGCETGSLSHYLADQGHSVVGVDLSADMIKAARKKAQLSSKQTPQFMLADATALPFVDNQFDGVVAASLINLLAEPHKALAEMQRVCRPGGKICVLVPQKGFSDQQCQQLTASLGIKGFSAAALYCWHRFAKKCSEQDLRQYFKQANIPLELELDLVKGLDQQLKPQPAVVTLLNNLLIGISIRNL